MKKLLFFLMLTLLCIPWATQAQNCATPTNFKITWTHTDTTQKISFYWTRGGEETAWVVQYGWDYNFSDGSYTEVTSGFSENEYTHEVHVDVNNGFTLNRLLYARVRANCNGNYSDWSPVKNHIPSYYSYYMNHDIENPATALTTGYMPIYGDYSDRYTLSYVDIPADRIPCLDIAGGTLKGLTYFTATPNDFNFGGAHFKVYLKEVDYTSWSIVGEIRGHNWNEMTMVYWGPLNVVHGQMYIPFQTDFPYNGDNLVISFEQTSEGATAYTNWLAGGGYENGSALYGYLTDIEIHTPYTYGYSNRQPTVAITYEPTLYVSPSINHIAVTNTTASIEWFVSTLHPHAELVSYKYQIKESSESHWPNEWIDVTEGLSYNFRYGITVQELTPGTEYDFRVKAVYQGGHTSKANKRSFTTLSSAENLCYLTFELTDDEGDGWNGNAIEVIDYQTRENVAYVRNENLDSLERQSETNIIGLPVTIGQELEFRWFYGDYADQCSWVVKTPSGDILTSGDDATGFNPGGYMTSGVLMPLFIQSTPGRDTYVVDCTPGGPSAPDTTYCDITFKLTDSYGDGWDGNAIQVVDATTGDLIATMANENLNGTSHTDENELNTKTLSIQNGRGIMLLWVRGNTHSVYNTHPEECSWVITGPNGDTISAVAAGGANTFEDEKWLAGYTMSCPTVTPTPSVPSECEITFELTDSDGDGWNGNAIEVYDDTADTLIQFMANENLNGLTGYDETGPELNLKYLTVQNGQRLRFQWKVGHYANECSWVITAPNGYIISAVAGDYANNLADGEVITTYTVSCPAVTPTPTTPSECDITIELTDSYGDGWNGNSLIVKDVQTGSTIDSLTIDDGRSLTYNLTVSNGQEISFEYNSDNGQYQSENGYDIIASDGSIIASHEAGTGAPYSGTIATYTVNCASCYTPLVTVDNWTSTTANISWTDGNNGTPTYIIKMGNEVLSGSTTPAVSINGTTATLTGLTPEHYYLPGDFTVTANCDENDFSSAANVPGFYTSYCRPAPVSVDGNGITNVSFGTGNNIVNNSSYPTSAPYYGDYTSQIGAVTAGQTATVDITYNTCFNGGSGSCYNYGTLIWVDWNNNKAFEDNEIVFAGLSSPEENPAGEHTLNATFAVSPNQATGDYRMRIGAADSRFNSYINTGSGPHDPCYSESYAVFHDYTLRVIEVPSCPPVTNLQVIGMDPDAARITWTHGGNETLWDLYWTTSNVAPTDTTTPTVGRTPNDQPWLAPLTPNTHYYAYVRARCSDENRSQWSPAVEFTTISPYTITFNAGNGGTATVDSVECGGYLDLSNISATPTAYCQNDWLFIGWSETPVSETTTAPTLLGNNYYPSGDTTLYAVFQQVNNGTAVFNFANLASENSWANGTAYTPVTISPVTITANGGGNNGKYYTSDQSWRMYDGGSVSISVSGANVTSVTSVPNKNFTINAGTASLNIAATTKFTSITVEYEGTTYNSNPVCAAPSYTITYLDGNDILDVDTFEVGANINPIANPTKEGYTFTGWSPALPATMPDYDFRAVAQWQIDTFTVTATANFNERGIVSGAGRYTYRSQVEMRAEAAQGYLFDNWTDEQGTVVSTAAIFDFEITHDTTFIANFITMEVALPTILPEAAGNVYTEPVSVSIRCETQNASIYYTLDGSEPTANSTLYTGPFTLTENTTVKAIAMKANMTNSAVATANYTINIPVYTVNFDAGDGIPTANTAQGNVANPIDWTNITANPSQLCANDWTFAGWSETPVAETTSAPAFVSNPYVPTANNTLYAVYKKVNNGTTVFNFADLASEYGWSDGTAYTTVTISPVTITANGGGNNGKYYTSNDSWRMYNGGTVSISATGANVTSVTSDPNKTFTINAGIASLATTTRTDFTTITVEYESTTYNSNPVCAVPTFTVTTTIEPMNAGTVSGAGTYDDGTSVTLMATPATGYSFSYWQDMNIMTYLATETSNPLTFTLTEDREYKAVFTPNTYNLTLEAMQGTLLNGFTRDTNYVYGVGFTLPTASQVEYTGYSFGGWYDNYNFTGNALTAIAATDTGNITVYALWTPKNYTITYMDGNNVLDFNTFAYGANINPIADPTKEGYTFTGWDPVLPTIMPAENLTVNAQWQIDTFTVTAIANYDERGTVNGGGRYTYRSVAEMQAVAGSDYLFNNWTDRYGTVVSTEPNFSFEVTKDTAFIANFVTVEVADPTILPEAAGVVFTEPVEVTISCTTQGAAIYYTTNGDEPTANSTLYTGSFTLTEDATVKAIATKANMINSQVVIANYTISIPVYTVNFDAGNGTTTATTAQGNVVNPIDLSNITATPTELCANDWTFAGWSTVEVTETTDELTTLVSNPYVPTADNITLYAVYQKTEQGGTNSSTSAGTWEKATSIAVGDQMILVCESASKEMSSYYASGSNSGYGVVEDYTTTPVGRYPLTVEAGSAVVSGSFAFKTNENDYLAFSGGNNNVLNKKTNVDVASSWTVEFDNNGNATISNGNTNTRKIKYNSSSPRFACYTSAQTAIQLYKYVTSTAPATTTYNSNPVCAPATHTVTATANNAAYGTVSGDGVYNHGAEVEMRAEANEGYLFINWTDIHGTVVSTNAYFDFEINSDTAFIANFKVNSYTLTYMDGENQLAQQTYDYNAAVTAIDNPTKEGYNFVGWNPNVPDNMPAHNDTVRAQWRINSYTLTYMDGEAQLAQQTYEYNAAVTAIDNPTKEGYNFVGWNPNVPDNMPAHNDTVRAQWRINSYTLTYMDGEEQLAQQTYEYNAAVTAIDNPTKEGYTFVGWNPTVPDNMPAHNDTVRAQWRINSYTVTATVNPDNAGTVTGAGSYNYGSQVEMKAEAEEGYLFTNWTNNQGVVVSTSAIFDFEIANDTVFTANFTAMDVVATPTFSPAEGSYLDSVKVTLECATNGATIYYTTDGSTPTATSAIYNGPFTLTANSTTIKAIAMKEGLTNSEMATATYVVTPTYTVTIADNIANGTVRANMIKAAEGVTVNLTPIADEGYHFGAWNVTTETGTIIEVAANNSFAMPAGNVTISATFEPNSYNITVTQVNGGTITVIVEGATAGTTSSTTADFESQVLLSVVNENGYTFNNFVVNNADGTPVAITPTNSFIMPANDVTVSASFNVNEYTITYMDGNDVLDIDTFAFGAAITPIADPNKEGYTFNGWDPALPTAMSAEDLTVYAQWQINSYNLTVNYKYADGTTAVASHTEPVNYNAAYSVNSPAITGYTPDQAVVSGTMGTADVTVDVTYNINSYKLTINYKYADGTEAATAYTFDYNYNETYSVNSPAITGYTPDQAVVSGTMGTADVTVDVTYNINSYNITVNQVTGGTITVMVEGATAGATSNTTADYNSLVQLSVVSDNGYTFDNFVVTNADDTPVAITPNNSFIMPANDVTVSAVFNITPAELSWSAESFTGYSFIDFNSWKPTLNNPNNVSVRYGCVEGNVLTQGGVMVDATTGVIGNNAAYGNIVINPGTYHIYAVHDTDPTYYYDSVVYTLNVERGTIVALQQNIDEGGTVAFADYTDVATLTHAYMSNSMAFVAHDDTVRVQAEPTTGYHFSEWQSGNLVDGYTTVSTEALYTYMVPSAESIGIKAVFDTNVYVLNVVSANEVMGSVSGSTQAKYFLSYEISATANTGYHFVQWNDGNTDNPRLVTLTEDATYTAEFDVNSYNLTINYKYADGTTAAASHTEPVNYNAAYSVNSPAITGYTPDQAVVSGTMGTADVTVDVTYSINSYNLTVNYKYADGTTAAASHTETVNYNATYSVNSPAITGYTPDQAVVSGTMGTADVTVDVTYSINSYNLTVNYKYADGTTAAASHTETVNYNAAYSVNSPAITGYTPDQAVVSGTMGTADVTVDVTYTVNSYNITVNQVTGGTITVIVEGATAGTTSNTTADFESQVQLSVVSDNGYTFDNFVVTNADGTPVAITPTNSFFMPANDVTVSADFSVNSYTLTINYKYADGTEAATTYTETIEYNTAYSVASPVLTGYTASPDTVSGTMGTADVTVDVTYSVNSYNITINQVTGGTITVTANASATAMGTSTTTNTTAEYSSWVQLFVRTDNGYTFNDFVVTNADGSTIEIINNGFIMPANDVTVSASFNVNEYTITYMDGNDVLDVDTFAFGAAITPIADPHKEGYTFNGWDPALPTAMPAEDLTVNAQWQVNSYYIDINQVTGGVVMVILEGAAVATTIGDSAEYNSWISLDVLTRDGYSFGNYVVTTADGSAIEITNNGFHMPASDVTVSATFNVNEYTITYMDDNTMLDVDTFAFGAAITPIANPTKVGYTFNGWNPALPTTMPDSNMTVYAQWQVNSYDLTVNQETGGTITVMVEGATAGTTSNTSADYNSWVQLSVETEYGYDFAGFVVTNADGTTIETPNNGFIMPANNVTVTANFTLHYFTVNVNVSDETPWGTVTGSGSFIYGSLDTLTATASEGHIFVGWSDFSTENPHVITVTQDSTITAFFVPEEIEIISNDTLMGAVSVNVPGGHVSHNTPIVITANPAPHYHFVSWSDGNTDNPRTLLPIQTIGLTAIFAIDQHTITLLRNDVSWGSVLGEGTYDYGTVIFISADAEEGYEFLHWDDGNTDNPRTITVVQDSTFTAIFQILDGINDANLSNVTVYSYENHVVVTNAEGFSVEIFDMSGRLVVSERSISQSVRKYTLETDGIYLVKVGNSVFKKVKIVR